MENKIRWSLVFWVALVSISGGLCWQWMLSGTLGFGIVGIALMSIGIWKVFAYKTKLATKSTPKALNN